MPTIRGEYSLSKNFLEPFPWIFFLRISEVIFKLFALKVASSWAEGAEIRQGDPLSPSLGLMAGGANCFNNLIISVNIIVNIIPMNALILMVTCTGGLVGYSHYPAYTTSPPQYRRAQEGQEFRRGDNFDFGVQYLDS